MKKYILELLSSGNELSSKRFLAFLFSFILIFVIFFKFEISYVYALMSFITALLGITGIEKFSNNSRKNHNS